MYDKHTTKHLIVSLYFILFWAVYSPAQNITLRDIPSQDKLPVNAIHRIFQDSDGYMWYGTFNGLCRYDGYNIRVFRSDLFHPGLLANNYITYIAEDHQKKIWFGTREGLYTLDKTTSRITPISLEGSASKDVFSINVTSDGSIWVSVSGTMFRFRSDGAVIKTYPTVYNHSPRVAYLVYENQTGDLLISLTGGGMYKLNEATNEFEAYYHHPQYMDIERIIWDDVHQCYWLGTWGRGIVRFNPQENEPENQYLPQPLPVDILGKPIANLFHMVQDDVFRYLWVTTERDLFAFRITGKGMLEQVETSSFLPKGNKMLYEIYKDKDGKLWVSSFDIPSFIVDIREYTVKDYPLQSLKDKLKVNPAILSLCVDVDNVFWFTQERYGLYTYHPGTGKLRHYSESKETQYLPFWEVPQLISSPNQNSVWAMPYGNTIYQLKQENGEMKKKTEIRLSDAADHPGENSFMYQDSKNKLWIGTYTSLFVYAIQTGKLELVSQNIGYVSAITETADGHIWVAIKNKGIGEVSMENNITTHPFNKDFLCMDATSDGKLWLGTGEGEVLMFDPETKQLTDHSLACGMKGDIINSITVDVYNHVWIATNQMIKEYNPRNGAYCSYNTRNKNFLPDRLLSRAVSYDRKGEIYYGGISGIVSIPPSQQLESIPEHVKTHITDIKILGKSIYEEQPEENPTDQVLSVSPTDQNLEIEFSSLDLHHLEQIRYAYRMVGVDNDWVYLDGGRNSAFYNKLDKGTYTFEVKATDKNGLWSNEITAITIDRLPAFYETWWAYTLYILLFVGIAWAILHLYLQRLKQENEKKVAEQVAQLELHYFASAPLDEQLITKALEAVEANLNDQNFDVNTLAEHLHISRATLTRKVKAITGQTPLEFIRDIKMKHACRMLENPNVTISEVVVAIGYNDNKHFTALFKDAYGVTPSEYQKGKRNL